MGRIPIALGWACAALTCGLAVVHAEPPALEVSVAAGAPLSADDLRTALSLRAAELGPDDASVTGAGTGLRIAVTPTGNPGVVEVAVEGARRAVDLGGLTGAAAARRIAVISIDLLHRPPPPPPVAVEAMVPPPAPPPTPRRDLALGTTATRTHRAPRFTATVSALHSTAGTGGGLDLGVVVLTNKYEYFLLQLLAGAELSRVEGANRLRVTNLPIRIGVGYRLKLTRSVTTIGSAHCLVARNHIGIDDGNQRLGHTVWRTATEGSLGIGIHLFGAVYADLIGRLQVYDDRLRYQVGGIDVYTKKLYDASIGLGVTVAMGAVR